MLLLLYIINYMYGHKGNFTIDDIMGKRYIMYNSVFFKDCKFVLDKIYSRNETLTSSQLDNLIKKMVKGKSRSLMTYRIAEGIELLGHITEKHLLSEKQVTLIIECIISCNRSIESFQWIDNLIALGYELSDMQINKLVSMNYQKSIDMMFKKILQKDCSNIRELNLICSSPHIPLEDIEKYLNKYKINPTLETVESIIQMEKNKDPNIKTPIADLILMRILLLSQNGLQESVQVIQYIYKIFLIDILNDYIDKLFDKNIISKMSDINFMFKQEYHLPIVMENIIYMLKKFEQYNIPRDFECLKNLMTQITRPAKYQEDNINQYNYGRYTNSNIEKYFDIIISFLKDSPLGFDNITYELELLEHACYISDILMFDILIKKINTYTNKCVINACVSWSINMLNILFDMKALPTLECVKQLGENRYRNIEIFNILLKNGLPINMETIDAAFEKEIYISSLDNYNVVADIELYKLCYKYDKFPNEYITQLDKNPSVNMDLRLSIANKQTGPAKTQEEIIEEIVTRGITPDYTMYDHAVCNNKLKLIQYFENEWKMKPSLNALVLIPDLTTRKQYMKRIIECHNIDPSIIISVAVPQENMQQNMQQIVQQNAQYNVAATYVPTGETKKGAVRKGSGIRKNVTKRKIRVKA